ncbi:pyridoxamine 5'-phosphate oxidase [Pseudoalteromonas phenolica]|uniref:pyridoxamine 5'-phosphate oxidase n=1 Tax=Pseudoalteromonas phenolica TaxID=161398 RepID=UPI00110A15C2|nr:pyridoxamine 5'-phosphate oxidase [Pseudoalteromonas phenolica]TMO56345.1 pyridoxamine 5'-phosphate oxidase [Pseudoalteromonas phenolica]
MNNPIEKFNDLWQQALLDSPLQQKSAVCVSTINAEGFPESRFVDLKQVDEQGFVFCTYYDSNKGQEISRNPKVSLSVWWDHIGQQIRVVGLAEQISEQAAIQFWQTRSRSAQLTTLSCEQSQPLSSESALVEQFDKTQQTFEGKEVTKPENWGGYRIRPVSIEFLAFAESRLHLRTRFTKKNDVWTKMLLQP